MIEAVRIACPVPHRLRGLDRIPRAVLRHEARMWEQERRRDKGDTHELRALAQVRLRRRQWPDPHPGGRRMWAP
jgi:hypothetical protein